MGNVLIRSDNEGSYAFYVDLFDECCRILNNVYFVINFCKNKFVSVGN